MDRTIRQACWLSLALGVLGALGVLAALFTGIAHAQETPALDPGTDALVTQLITQLINGNVWLALGTGLWLVLAFLKGKTSWRVPYVSDWWDARAWWQRALIVGAVSMAIAFVAPLAGGAVVLPTSAYGDFGEVVRWLPSGALGNAMREALTDAGVAWRELAVLAGWAVGGAVLTARTFTWE